MNREEFSRLIYPYLDGELDAEQRHEVEVYLKSSEEARSILEFEQRLDNKTRDALSEPVDMVAKARLLASLHKAAGKTDPQPMPAKRASSRLWSRYPWQLPAAAAALFVALWLGGVFAEKKPSGPQPMEIAADNPSTSTQLIDIVNVSENRFRSNLRAACDECGCRYQGVKKCLDESAGPHFWTHGSKTPRAERYAKCTKLVSDCMGRKVSMPTLPERFELVGARRAELTFNGKTIVVPHLILMTDTERLSVYVICGSQSAEISKGLHEVVNSKKKDSCLLGCPQRGVMVRKSGDVWLVLISEMDYKKLQSVAEDI